MQRLEITSSVDKSFISFDFLIFDISVEQFGYNHNLIPFHKLFLQSQFTL